MTIGDRTVSDKARYVWLGVLFLAVSCVSLILYWNIASLVPKAIAELHGVNSAYDAIRCSWLSWVFHPLVAALFCWRIVKTVVLQGAPIPALIDFRSGRENGEAGGRPVRVGWIGRLDTTGEFWFGVVTKSHPSSDKLMRSRLEFLMVAIPFWRTLVVGGGRFYFRLMDHVQRHAVFDKCAGPYEWGKAWETQLPEKERSR